MDTQEGRKRREKGYDRYKEIYNAAMGLMYIGCGAFVIMAKRFGFEFRVKTSQVFIWALGGLFILYGLYRVYRGIKNVF